MPIEQVEKVWSESGPHVVNFMDITDFPHLDHINAIFPTIPGGPTHQGRVNSLIQQLSEDNIESTITRLAAFTPNRYYTTNTAVQAANFLAGEYRRYSSHRDDVQVVLFAHSWAQPSVIARIHGTGPSANEVVIIGGHIDSTAGGASARSPGADDDASGSACVLEIFRVLVESDFAPERTLEFHGYAAEEVGLRGSQDIAQRYLADGVEVVGMLQLDMTGYIRSGTNPTMGIVTDFTNAPLSAFLRLLVDEYTSTSRSNTQCGYACSDHGSWTRAGYPASFTFESIFSNSNPYIHTANDVLAYLDISHAKQFCHVGVGFAVELSFAE